MSLYALDSKERLVLVKFGRVLSIDDIASYVAELSVDPEFNRNFSEIVNLTEVEELQLSAEHALDLADVVDPFCIGAKRAFVARTEAQVHAARMHQVLRNDISNTRIFASLSDAKKWIAS